MEECRNLDRKELIKKTRKNRRNDGPKKIVFTSKWDPRGPTIHEAIKSFKYMLYMDRENERAFPPGTLINGSKRQKNIVEIIAPTKPTSGQTRSNWWEELFCLQFPQIMYPSPVRGPSENELNQVLLLWGGAQNLQTP